VLYAVEAPEQWHPLAELTSHCEEMNFVGIFESPKVGIMVL